MDGRPGSPLVVDDAVDALRGHQFSVRPAIRFDHNVHHVAARAGGEPLPERHSCTEHAPLDIEVGQRRVPEQQDR